MASKYFEVSAIDMRELRTTMAYDKYTQEQFVSKETKILSLFALEVDPPNIFHYVLFYFKLLRLHF
jgi:hypothetical protein